MKCPSPIWIRKIAQTVACGKCPICKANNQGDWITRLLYEHKGAMTSVFLTLTYAPEHVPLSEGGEQTLSKSDYQKFLKRVRKFQSTLNIDWPPIRYYAVGEYGPTTNRPHYHAIIFNLHPKTQAKLLTLWGKGHIMAPQANEKTIHYVTKYVATKNMATQDWSTTTRQKPFALITNRSGGIGKRYIDLMKKWHLRTKNFFVPMGKFMRRLPRYFRDKIFSKMDREINNIKVAALNLKRADEELMRLAAFTRNPYAYLDQMIEQHQRRLFIASTAKQKL